MNAGSRISRFFVKYPYANTPEPKKVVYIKAFLVARPMLISIRSSLILYIEKYETNPRNPSNPAFPSAKNNRLNKDRNPKYQSRFFIFPPLLSFFNFLLFISNLILDISNILFKVFLFWLLIFITRNIKLYITQKINRTFISGVGWNLKNQTLI